MSSSTNILYVPDKTKKGLVSEQFTLTDRKGLIFFLFFF